MERDHIFLNNYDFDRENMRFGLLGVFGKRCGIYFSQFPTFYRILTPLFHYGIFYYIILLREDVAGV